MRFFGIAITAALIVSCSTVTEIDSGDAGPHLPAVQSYTFYVEPEVDTNGQIAIAEAARQWTEFTDVNIVVLHGDLGCFDVGCFAIHQVSFVDFDALVDGNYIGYTIPYFVYLSTQITTYDELQDTAIHEMGHALGLLHPCTSPCDDYAVMNPDYGVEDHVGCSDVAQYYEIRPEVDASDIPIECTDVSGALDESSDGGPGDD
jgi:hypothetical protein